MPRTDRASLVVDAPLQRVYDALIDREALEAWLPPDGMTGRFDRFDPRPGGGYRLVLTYSDPSGSYGKSGAGTDVVEARYVALFSRERVVQQVEFVSDDPSFAGTMTMHPAALLACRTTLMRRVLQDRTGVARPHCSACGSASRTTSAGPSR